MHKMIGLPTHVHRRTLTVRISKAPAGTCFFCAFGAFLWPSIPVFRLIRVHWRSFAVSSFSCLFVYFVDIIITFFMC